MHCHFVRWLNNRPRDHGVRRIQLGVGINLVALSRYLWNIWTVHLVEPLQLILKWVVITLSSGFVLATCQSLSFDSGSGLFLLIFIAQVWPSDSKGDSRWTHEVVLLRSSRNIAIILLINIYEVEIVVIIIVIATVRVLLLFLGILIFGLHLP